MKITTGTLHVDQITFSIISRSVLRMRSGAEKIYVGKIKTHILYSVIPPPRENRAGYEIMWKNILEAGRPHTSAWLMRIA